jgi:EmrB/QacA subfamily drug resistance transporter
LSARDTALSLPSLGAADTGHPHKWLVLVAVSTGLILGILDASVVNIAIPTLMSGLSASVSEISWVLNAYNVAQAVLFLTFGRLAERFGQRVVFIGSLVVFTVFSLACGLSPNVEWLIVFRIGQAVGAAGIVPVSLIILLSAFPQREHGLATGLWGSLGTVAAIIGAPIGGVLIEYATWNWIFFMNVPIGIVAIAISLLVVPELRRDEDGAGIDLPGIVLSGVAIGCLILAIIEGADWGWGSAREIGLLVSAVVLSVGFVLWEKRAPRPMLDLALFRITPFSASTLMMIVGAVGMGGGMLLLVLFMVDVLGYSALWAALGTVPMAAVACVVSPFSGRLVDRVGPRQLAAVGAILFSLAFLLLAQLDSQSTFWAIAWRQVILGLGMSFTMPALTAAGLTPLPETSKGVGSGTNSTARAFGTSLGVALLLAIYQSVQSYSWPFIVAAIICLLSLPLAFLLGRRIGAAPAA